MFRASDIFAAFEKFSKDLISHVEAINKGKNDLDFLRLEAQLGKIVRISL